MKNLLIFISLILYNFSSQAQFVGLDWGYVFGDISVDQGDAIATDRMGNVYTAGSFIGTVDFDPGLNTFSLTSDSNSQDLFIQKLDAAGNLIWAHQIKRQINRDTLSVRFLEVDRSGNIYMAGHFSGTIDFDPGPATFSLSSFQGQGTEKDIYVLKLDPTGNFEWAIRLGEDSGEEIKAISTDPQGNLFINGNFSATMDFDPGPGIFPMTDSQNNGDAFVLKLNSSGDFLWAKQFGNIWALTVDDADTDQQGNIIFTGCFQGNMDFDVGPDTAFLYSVALPFRTDFYTLKLDPAGDFVWVSQITSLNSVSDNLLEVGPFGNVYLTGSFTGTINFDPASGAQNTITLNGGRWRDGYIKKLNPQGNFVWVKRLICSNNNIGARASTIRLDPSGNLYMSGSFVGLVDFDPGPDTLTLPNLSRSNTDYFVSKYTPSGDLLWAKHIEADQNRLIRDMTVDPGFNIYMTGRLYTSIDFEPGPGVFTLSPGGPGWPVPDFYVTKWVQDSCAGLAAIIDSVQDVSCINQGYASGFAVGGQVPYVYSWNTNPPASDSFLAIATPGIYELSVTDSDGCTRKGNTMIFGPSSLSSTDLKVNFSDSEFRPGRNSWIWIEATNTGCVSVTGKVLLTLDPFLSLVSANPPPDSISGNQLFWNVSNMNADSDNFRAQVEVNVTTQAMQGDQICNRAVFSRKATNNNTKFSDRGFCREVINSYDPNDKRVYPEGACEEGFIENGEILTYTLRFQNTGNASAIDIFLLDSLDVNLDLNSVRVLGQSHKPMITEVLEGRVLKFRFDNIYLPDSTTDEPNSHGYVMYEVSPLPNLAIGTEIKNKVGIYFDFNEPVITNTVLNTIIDVVPAQDTGFVQASACNGYELNGRLYTSSGDYFQLISRDGSCDSVVSLSLTLQPLDTSITQIGRTLTVREGGAHGLNVSYQWVDCANGNTPISGATSQSFTPQSNGNYAVIISRDNCSEMSSCIQVSTVGIDPDFQSEITYFPNPSTGSLQIDLGRFYSNTELEIFNTMGQRVYQGSENLSDKISLDLPAQGGLYFIKLTADGKSAVIKVWRK